MPESQPLLRMTGIVKTFPGVRALGGVDLDVRAGEVHCLLGQNGAGKSTLIKVLAGAHRPDEGAISWHGEDVTLATPQAAIKRGISPIDQELDLVPGLSVTDNVFLGHELAASGFTRRLESRRATRCSPRCAAWSTGSPFPWPRATSPWCSASSGTTPASWAPHASSATRSTRPTEVAARSGRGIQDFRN